MSNLWPAGCMQVRMAMNAAQHKTVNLLKALRDFCVCVITCHDVFKVWPKTTLLLPVWPKDAKILETPEFRLRPYSIWYQFQNHQQNKINTNRNTLLLTELGTAAQEYKVSRPANRCIFSKSSPTNGRYNCAILACWFWKIIIRRQAYRCNDFTYMWNLKNKINEQNKTDHCQMGGGLGDWMKKGKGLRRKGNTVNNIVITVYGVTWVLNLLGWSLHKVYKCLIAMSYTWC